MLTQRIFTRLTFLILLFPGITAAQSNWWKDAVFYEVFVRSFYDSNGDGKGDLNGLIEKLDYLNDGNPATQTDLGVTALWLMPVMPSPSYHGYDVTDYYGIESDYGTKQAFKNLIDSAHARGIKVIIDFVMNHTSSSHPWFQSAAASVTSPFKEYYVWEDSNPGFTGPWGQTVWYQRNGKWYYAVFWSEMPDLNYRNTAVQQEMKQTTRYWLDSMHVDGFRLDAIQFLVEDGSQTFGVPETYAFLEDWRSDYIAGHPDAFTVGEVWSATDVVIPYVQPGRLDMCFEFALASSILNSINASSPNELQNTLNAVNTAYPEGKYGTFLTNHDMNRVHDQLGQNLAKSKLAAAVYLTLPGTPFIYYGEEIGMSGTGDDPTKRKPMQWSNLANAGFSWGTPWASLASNYTTVNVAAQQQDPNSLWQTYRQLIALRKAHTALRKGNYRVMADANPEVLGYARYTQDELILVLHNFTASTSSNLAFALGTTGVPEGTYAVIDLLHPDDLVNPIVLGANGNATNYEPGVDIPAYGTRMLSVQIAPGFGVVHSSDNVRIYPNPAHDKLTLDFPVELTLKSLKVFDNNGRTVMISATTKSLTVSELPAGMYWLEMSFQSGALVRRSFVKD